MNLKDELDKILAGEKELGSEFLADLVNGLGNPTLANLLYGLVSSHVEVAKVVQQTPPAQAAPAAPAQVDTDAIVAKVMAQLLPAIQAVQQKPAESSVPQE